MGGAVMMMTLGVSDGAKLGNDDPEGEVLGSLDGLVDDDGKSDGSPLGNEDPLGVSLGVVEGV